jgi:hypothetical protein
MEREKKSADVFSNNDNPTSIWIIKFHLYRHQVSVRDNRYFYCINNEKRKKK